MIFGAFQSAVRLDKTAAAIGERQIFPMQTMVMRISGRDLSRLIKPRALLPTPLVPTLNAVQSHQPHQYALAYEQFLQSGFNIDDEFEVFRLIFANYR